MGIHFAWLLLLSPLSASAAPRAFTLTELFRATVDRSDRVQSKIEERTQAEETKSKSKAGFLPQISGIGTYQRNDSPPRSSATASIFPEQQKNARIVAKQYLFQGGSEYAYLSRTNSLLESKEAELEESRRTYYLDLAVAYYDLLLKRANLQHAKTELDLYDDQIKELNSRVKIGRSRRTDLLTARAGRASSESRLRAAETEVEAARLVLENLTKTENFQIREENPVDRPLDDLSAYLKASEQRPDLVAARKR